MILTRRRLVVGLTAAIFVSVTHLYHARHLLGLEYYYTERPEVPLEMVPIVRLREEWAAVARRATPHKPLKSTVLPDVWKRTCNSAFGIEAVTAVTHLGTTKLDRLTTQAARWGGPVSAAVYVTSPRDIDELISFWRGAVRFEVPGSCLVSIHVVMEYMHPRAHHNRTLASAGYPHNRMRNVALEHCATNYFATLDADFMTLPRAHGTLQRLLRRDDALYRRLRYNRTLLVMPALDTRDPRPNSLPTDRARALARMVKSQKLFARSRNSSDIYRFHSGVAPRGHNATDYGKWKRLKSNETWYDIDYAKDFEPYVVGYFDRDSVKRYHEPLRGFGFNKISWILHMHCASYRFVVLRDVMVFHVKHKLNSRELKSTFAKRAKKQFEAFKQSLRKDYPTCDMEPSATQNEK